MTAMVLPDVRSDISEVMKFRLLFSIVLIFLSCFSTNLYGKKIKNTLAIGKETRNKTSEKSAIEGTEIRFNETSDSVAQSLAGISFYGFDKEPNSNIESFILINPSNLEILGFEVKIVYLDMKDRMIHSRTVKEDCIVPPGESRRIDIPTWDKQHTYYYYLGNEPKKVATPFKVTFEPLAFRIN